MNNIDRLLSQLKHKHSVQPSPAIAKQAASAIVPRPSPIAAKPLIATKPLANTATRTKLAELLAKHASKQATVAPSAPAATVTTKLPTTALPTTALPAQTAQHQSPQPTRLDKTAVTWEALDNDQRLAISKALDGGNLLLTGAAGTGKSTTQRTLLQQLADSGILKLLPVTWEHRYIPRGGYSVAIISFITRAVNNIRDLLPEVFKPNACNIHQFLEFAPVLEEYEDIDEDGNLVIKTRKIFEPRRHAGNPIIGLTTIIVEESSTVDTLLFDKLLDALPDRGANIQFIFLGDICQLKPVMGQSIMAKFGPKWLAEDRVVELTTVRRTALDSPIKALATAINQNTLPATEAELQNFAKQGELALVNYAAKGRAKPHVVAPRLANALVKELTAGNFVPFRDVVLVPYRKAKPLPWLCSEYFNQQLAQAWGDLHNATVYEVVAGFLSHYLAVGDPILLDKEEYTITGIRENPKYQGTKLPKPPSTSLDRTGHYKGATNDSLALENFASMETYLNEQVAKALAQPASPKDKEEEEAASRAASHILTLRSQTTGETVEVSNSGEVNNIAFAFAITVHKSIGSEWERVYLITHHSHYTMLTRELLYTAVTRAKSYLCVMYEGAARGEPSNLQRAATTPWIKGTNLKDKLLWLAAEEARKSEDTSGLLAKFKPKRVSPPEH